MAVEERGRLRALLALSEDADGQSVALPGTGDLQADHKLVMRPTAEEFADPSVDRLIEALKTEITNGAVLAAEYREKLAQPLEKARLVQIDSTSVRAHQHAAATG